MKVVIPILALSTLIASSVSCWSASAVSDILKVKLEVRAECSVGVDGGGVLDFGNNGRVTEDIRIQGSIQVQCNHEVAYTIGLNNGRNWSKARRMKSESGSFIVYELYQDSERKNIWAVKGGKQHGRSIKPYDAEYLQVLYAKEGALPSEGTAFKETEANGSVQPFTVYGRVLKSDATSAPPGEYSDTVTVEVRF